VGQNNGSAVIVAATILGISILGGSYMLGRSVDGAALQLGAMQAAIAKSGTGALAAAAPAKPRRGPDPSKVYKVKTEGSPIQGPKTAKVTIAEFSDFQ
jgi:protein-disulfide isomerase